MDTYPVYFFAASSPFIKYAVEFSENDQKIVNHLVENPIDDRFSNKSVEEDPLEQLEKFQTRVRNQNMLNLSIFDESHTNMPLKEYIRKWSNWVIDFHWIFTLKYFIEFLPTNKLLFFIKNYPSLDNFILHWMWWSYSLNKDLERFTKDPFRAIGSMPWLTYDVCQRDIDKQPKTSLELSSQKSRDSKSCALDQKLEVKSQNDSKKVLKQPSKFFQYNEFTIKTIGSILFQEEPNGIERSNFNLNNPKKLTRSQSYSNGHDIIETNVSDSFDLDKEQPPAAEIQLQDFKQTYDYLKTQTVEINKTSEEHGSPLSETTGQPRLRSKSLNNQSILNSLDCESPLVDNKENVYEDSIFNNDELDKTIVYFEMGCCDKEEISKKSSQTPPNPCDDLEKTEKLNECEKITG